MPAVIAMLILTGLGCGTVTKLASTATSATATCERCGAGMAVGVGATLNVRVDWDRCSELEPGCDANAPPFVIDARCEGIACTIVDTGGGYLEVTPTEAGTATLVVDMKDKLSRTDRFGPFTAAVVDAIDMECTYIAPGAQEEPCPAAIPPDSDVYVGIVARAGERRLAAPVPREVLVDNRFVFQDGQAVGGPWACAASSLSTDDTVPSVTRCHLVGAPAGRAFTIEARLPAQRLGARTTVRIAAR